MTSLLVCTHCHTCLPLCQLCFMLAAFYVFYCRAAASNYMYKSSNALQLFLHNRMTSFVQEEVYLTINASVGIFCSECSQMDTYVHTHPTNVGLPHSYMHTHTHTHTYLYRVDSRAEGIQGDCCKVYPRCDHTQSQPLRPNWRGLLHCPLVAGRA